MDVAGRVADALQVEALAAYADAQLHLVEVVATAIADHAVTGSVMAAEQELDHARQQAKAALARAEDLLGLIPIPPQPSTPGAVVDLDEARR